MEDLKQIERAGINRTAELREAEKPKPKPKEGKSVFDDLLEQSRKLQEGAVDTKTVKNTQTREAVAEAEKQREKRKDQSKDSEKEEERKQDSKGEKREGAEGAKKVYGKANLKQNQGGSGGHSSEGGFSHRKGERSFHGIKKSSLAKETAGISQNGFTKEFQNQLLKTAQARHTKIPQEILNQVVKMVRVGLARDGSKILELECHQELFQGLKLRFRSRDGKVALEFLTATGEMRALFEKKRDEIRNALEKKGIAVETIHVV